jgi:ABC-type polysaccharide/polyol phosphate export permease
VTERTVTQTRGRTLRLSTSKLADLWRARELLLQLVQKELKVRYKNSALGFFWSMLTPALMTVVFTVVFTLVVPIPVDAFAAYFLSGYLFWQFFQNSCQGAIHSIVDNGDLVKKVYFPREVLPLSHVLAQLVHLLLALLVILPYLTATRGIGVITHLPGALLAVLLLTIFASGMAMWFASVNVVFRDLQELFIVIFLVWFYSTPVLYPLALVHAELGADSIVAQILAINPMTWFVEAFRAPLYGPVVEVGGVIASGAPTWATGQSVGLAAMFAVTVFAFGYVVFLRGARTFAKEV